MGRAGEMAWLVKCVPCKCDDLTSVLRVYVKKHMAAGTGHMHTRGDVPAAPAAGPADFTSARLSSYLASKTKVNGF